MEERILVCLSSSPSNGKIIRTAAQMAEAFNGTLTALFVETPLAGKMGKEDQERLKGNIKLAKQSGAEIETVYGDDISFQIAEFARLSGITRIVIGRSAAKKKGIPVLTEEDIPAISLERCGLSGSPTKVKKTYTPVTEKNGVKLEGMEAEDAAKEVVKLIYDAKIL